MSTPVRIPRATYRVQLHKGFNFDRLAEIIPYLDELGVSDIYMSPIFCAGAGSTHGYDVCDHNKINDELGGMDGLMKVSQLLRERNMGVLVDFVPNHMGTEGPLNWRWMDVLEYGHQSRFANFFDIQWNPRQVSLQDRILMPILHDFYGRVLDGGDISLRYVDEAFWVCYRSLRFPLRPESYGKILQRLAWFKNPGSPRSQKLEKIADEFSALPMPLADDSLDDAERRNNQRDFLRRELAGLFRSEKLIPDLDDVLQALNGTKGNADSFDQLHEILEQQNYRLAFWKTGTHEINYRRFFAVDSLVGLQMESARVFDECHQLLRDLVQDGVVNGVRIDHIDGLWNPAEYLLRLREITGGNEKPTYTLVEKILTEKEDMIESWAVDGTTGYDFAADLINLLITSRSESEFTRIYRDFAGMTMNPDEQAYRLKLFIMEELFPNAIDNLALELEAQVKSDRRWRDWTVSELKPALARIIACLSVYRTYRTVREPASATDIHVVKRAVVEAMRLSHAPDPLPFQFIQDVWTGAYPDEKADPGMKTWAETWVCKLQQYTGAIMAKSMEDTMFYRYVRLFAANEVGHHPAEFGRSTADFHGANEKRLKAWPASMLSTSTHDTKMSEDVRARLLALSEIPEVWEAALTRWSKINHTLKTLVNDRLAPDANEEYLLYQILLGAWPLDGAEVDETFRNRIKDYTRKALAESKVHTNWASPDEEWIKACDDFIDKILDPQVSPLFRETFVPLAEQLAYEGMRMSLVQVALKLTSPGVPDVYQGNELWDFSLVDPDNRREIDYAIRQSRQKSVAGASVADLMATWKDGRIKLHLTQAILRYRREHPTLFSAGSYTALKVSGPTADRFVAFLRQEGERRVLVVALHRMNRNQMSSLAEVCAGVTVTLPEVAPAWRDLLGTREVKCDSSELPLADLFAGDFPVTILAT